MFLLIPCDIFSGRKVAIDASMSIYQFLIAVRTEGAQLTGVDGETTRFAKLKRLCDSFN